MWRRSFSDSATSALKDKKWDALVIGGGHNGLTAAAYLARAGLSVAVLERRHLIGGAAITEELVPGFRFSRCSYLQSLLRPSIIRELELQRHGLRLLKRSPSSFTPCLDGRYLLLGPDKDLNRSEISKFSERDADAYPSAHQVGVERSIAPARDHLTASQKALLEQCSEVVLHQLLCSLIMNGITKTQDSNSVPRADAMYENQLEKFCKFMDLLLDSAPPESLQGKSSFKDQFKNRMHISAFWARCLRQAVALGQKDMVDFMDLLLSPASQVLNNWFETDVLKATLGTDAVIGTTASVHTPGSGYVLLHHVMGETDGDRGVWSYVEGGMGSVSLAIGNAAREHGAHVVTSAEVSQLLIEDTGAVNGVLLADGTLVHSSIVLSNATPYRTFMDFVPKNVLPDDFMQAIKYSDYSSGTTKINLAVDKLPEFQCCKLGHPNAGPQHVGTIHIGSESMEEIHAACQDAANGLPSRRPIIEMTIPSVLDRTISPPGKHVINLFIQYTPHKPLDGSWGDPAYRDSFAQKCFTLIDEYAPSFSSSIIGYDMLTPPDLEREFGLTGGNIFHGAMGLDSLFLMRPVKGWSNYRTPLRGLYLCGAGGHPGGGVMGAPGRNAAQLVLQNVKKHLN